MKQITLFLVLVMLVPLFAAEAQPNTRKIYRDSVTAISTGDQAAKLARGYGAPWAYLRKDVGSYKDKQLVITFANTLDSVRIDGGVVRFGVDTAWVPLAVPVIYPRNVSQINTAAGSNTARDTLVTWLTTVGASPIMTRVVDLSEFYFPIYRVVVGLNDTGKVHLIDIRRGGY